MRIAICDDQAADRAALGELLWQVLSERCATADILEYQNGEMLLQSLETETVPADLIFLDIYMDGPDGMETAKCLRQDGNGTPIVFLTTSPDFAVDSYEVRAFDYILKPITAGRLAAVLSRFETEKPRHEKFLALKEQSSVQRLSYDAIEYVESVSPALLLHMSDGKEIRYYGKLNDMEQQLADERFLRCHQSFLVNLDLVERLEDDFLMRSGARVPFKQRDKKKLREVYFSYILKEG